MRYRLCDKQPAWHLLQVWRFAFGPRITFIIGWKLNESARHCHRRRRRRWFLTAHKNVSTLILLNRPSHSRPISEVVNNFSVGFHHVSVCTPLSPCVPVHWWAHLCLGVVNTASFLFSFCRFSRCIGECTPLSQCIGEYTLLLFAVLTSFSVDFPVYWWVHLCLGVLESTPYSLFFSSFFSPFFSVLTSFSVDFTVYSWVHFCLGVLVSTP